MARSVQPARAPNQPDPRGRPAIISGRRIGLVFWIGWVFATVAGLGAYSAANWALSGEIHRAVRLTFGGHLSDFVPNLVNGALVGILQGLVLRGHTSRAGLWVFASAVGFAASSFAATNVRVGSLGDFPLVGLAIWAPIGILGGLAFRWKLPRVSLWVLANAIGFAAGTLMGIYLGFAVGWDHGLALGLLVGYAVGGAVMGAITGIALVLLLRRPTDPSPPRHVPVAGSGLNPRRDLSPNNWTTPAQELSAVLADLRSTWQPG